MAATSEVVKPGEYNHRLRGFGQSNLQPRIDTDSHGLFLAAEDAEHTENYFFATDCTDYTLLRRSGYAGQADLF